MNSSRSRSVISKASSPACRLPRPRASPARAAPAAAVPEPVGPDAPHLRAQDRLLKAGGKLSDQEKFKRELHPFDGYEKLKAQAAPTSRPSLTTIFAGASTACSTARRRSRPICAGCAFRTASSRLAVRRRRRSRRTLAGGYAHVTTRANLQMREIEPKNAVAMVEHIQDIGLCSRGSGADNIRNVTGTPTAGIDPQELLDTRPYAREWHFHILNDRTLYGIPRKFNVGFDGGGVIAVLEDTNDIGFRRSRSRTATASSQASGFASRSAASPGTRTLPAKPASSLSPRKRPRWPTRWCGCSSKMATAPIAPRRGSNTCSTPGASRNSSPPWRKSSVASWCGCRPRRIKPRPPFDRIAHIGVHAQKQAGLNWIGVALPVGRMTARRCADLPRSRADLGDGDMRLTVWQNLLISGVADDARRRRGSGDRSPRPRAPRPTSMRAGLVACTGNAGCKFAASDTKRHAEEIAAWCETRVAIDTPINIHLTGCHHSCAQHFISEIGLLACKVQETEDGDRSRAITSWSAAASVPHAALGREIYRDVKADDAPRTVERMLKAYLAHRSFAAGELPLLQPPATRSTR